MTFSNKTILTIFGFTFPIWLTIFQNSFTVLLLYLSRSLGYFSIKDLEWEKVQRWLPLSILFSLVLVTSQYSLGLLSVPMVVIFKQFTTIAITIGDKLIYGNPLTPGISASLVIMFVGSMVAGLNDLEFNLAGYIWMGSNCVVQTAYSLYQKKAIKDTGFNEFSASYYNNILAIPAMLCVFAAFPNEFYGVLDSPAFQKEGFNMLLIFNGFCGFAISLGIFWAFTQTSPATFSVVGSLNKIPLTVLGGYIFHTPFSTLGIISIVVSLGGGVVFSLAKLAQQTKPRPEPIPHAILVRSQ